MTLLSRREFLMATGAALLCPLVPAPVTGREGGGSRSVKGQIFTDDAPSTLWKWSRKAGYFQQLGNGKVMCTTCPNQCLLSPGDRSVCRSKVNVDGVLYTLAYGNPCAVNMDPVEKKPLFHYMPGTRVFSIAAAGCNFRCLNCQNWEISQVRPEAVRHYDLFPEQAVQKAVSSGCRAVAYTYSEPTTFYEYMADTAAGAKKNDLGNLWISNGYINRVPLENLCTRIDGANVNLKSFSDEIYRKLNGGRLQPVLETFKTLHDKQVHFEMTNLVIPGYTDDETMMKRMCRWILENLGPDHPLHFLRFFPKYKLQRINPTSVSLLTRFRKTALDMGIRYVYVGNVPNHEGNHTFCHSCGRMLVKREGYVISQMHITDSTCRFCGAEIAGVWDKA